MLRFFLVMAVPFFLPVVLLKIWQMLRPLSEDAAEPPSAGGAVWILGAVLAVASLITFVLLNEDETSRDGRYTPPRAVDGEIVPGHFEPDEDTVPEDDPPRLR